MENPAVAVTAGTEGPTRCREFSLFDAMVLIAGVAVGLSGGAHLLVFFIQTSGRLCAEAAAHVTDLPEHWPLFWGAVHDDLRNTLWYGFQVLEACLAGMTPAFFVVRLRRPRPPLRALVRNPGAVAGLAMVFGLFWGTGFLLAMLPGKVDSFTAAAVAAGGAVALAWVGLALGRRWEPEPGWIDRVGRLLGCVAIAAAMLGMVVRRI